jgi:tRNA threonylcarbamoyladenosine biosynthesis protein TsaB
MNLILNIDTALEQASICLAKDGVALQLSTNETPKAHASWLQAAVVDLLKKSGHSLGQLSAVSVSIGPGSYTGLRVGLASAKGFCYALKIPLITVGTLEMIAFAAKDGATGLICPMIDARRMEVFTALYDKELTEISAPGVMILDETSFADLLSAHKILFCGNGSKKLQLLISGNNVLFSDLSGNASHLAFLSHKRFQQKEFAQLASAEPLYIKEFYSPALKLRQ